MQKFSPKRKHQSKLKKREVKTLILSDLKSKTLFNKNLMHVKKIPYCIWMAPHVHEYPPYKKQAYFLRVGGILCLSNIIGISSLPPRPPTLKERAQKLFPSQGLGIRILLNQHFFLLTKFPKTFDLKNMISTSTNDFSQKKMNQIRQIVKGKKNPNCQIFMIICSRQPRISKVLFIYLLFFWVYFHIQYVGKFG